MVNKIIVCQTGSRHRYLIPQLLEKNKMLKFLYTDSTLYSLCGKLVSFMRFLGIKNAMIVRLLKRKPQIDIKHLKTTDVLFYKEFCYNLFSIDSLRKRYLHYNGFVGKCIKWGVQDADCIYSMYIENFDFLVYAKSRGLKIVVDIYETPMTYQYLIEEIDNNPEYNIFSFQKKAFYYSHQVRMHYMESLLELADYYTIPSQFVIDSMGNFKNFNLKKVCFLPYASSILPENYGYKPIKHRIIWVGNEPIRKGLIYCAKAATKLKEIYPDLDFRIVGNINEKIKEIGSFKDLHFVGILNKEELMEEYRTAEAYVFPTLFEGFAGTIIEAACCGCPIITTKCAGTNVKEFPAIYIPPRDVASIVEKVCLIFENSTVRNKLSIDVYNYSKTLTPMSYERKLITFFKSIN